ncbi:hypothetical protein BU161_01305 [Corynebacterium diphtheriae]|nr:hypothetical protein BU161_01305 [Corynebacterium diphtheriae]
MLLMSSSSPSEKKLVAKLFAKKWADRGNEKSDTHSFWLELLRDVVGMEDVTTNVRFESRRECPIVCVRGAWFTSSPRIGRGKPRLVG